jgi:hypothetical protein
MREKFLILDALKEVFADDMEDEDKQGEAIKKFMAKPSVQRLANERVDAAIREAAAKAREASSESGGPDDGGSSTSYAEDGNAISAPPRRAAPVATGPSPADIERMRAEMLVTVAAELVGTSNKRYDAYKFIVGVYKSSDYHLKDLRRICRYFVDAAEKGDPIAQYHLVLFLKYLGDITFDGIMDKSEVEHLSQEWLSKVRASGLPESLVKDLETQLAFGAKMADKRAAGMQKKLDALKKVETDKLNQIDVVLAKVSQRIGGQSLRGGPVGGGGTNNRGRNSRRSSGSGDDSSSSSE